jgi:hypothetical protein
MINFMYSAVSSILNSYYGQQFDYNKPLFYDIPNSDGIISHYRILYNVDFIEIYPTEKTVPLTSMMN